MVTSSSPAGPRGRPKAELSLADEERHALERLARRRTSAQAMALRARIILSSAAGSANVAVAEELGVAPATVGKWRRRFVARRLDGLFDEPRPGAPRTVTETCRGGDREDLGGEAVRRDPLVEPLDRKAMGMNRTGFRGDSGDWVSGGLGGCL